MANLNIKLTLIGGPTVLIEFAGLRILTDPAFDPPGQYQSGTIVLKKTAGPALSAKDLGPVDAILLSHDQHFDNLDHAGRAFLSQSKIVFTTRAGGERLKANAKGLAPWEQAAIEESGKKIFVTATPARHGPAGFEPFSGEVAGFVLGTEKPGDAIYVTGDTVWYDGVAEVARRFAPKLVIAFAGAARPRGPFHITMDDNDLVETAHAFPQARIVAVHNHGWKHFTETQEDAVSVFKTLGISDRLQVLNPGQPVELHL